MTVLQNNPGKFKGAEACGQVMESQCLLFLPQEPSGSFMNETLIASTRTLKLTLSCVLVYLGKAFQAKWTNNLMAYLDMVKSGGNQSLER